MARVMYYNLALPALLSSGFLLLAVESLFLNPHTVLKDISPSCFIETQIYLELITAISLPHSSYSSLPCPPTWRCSYIFTTRYISMLPCWRHKHACSEVSIHLLLAGSPVLSPSEHDINGCCGTCTNLCHCSTIQASLPLFWFR